jgi:N-acyl-D-amino-acid deacylase
MAQTGTPVASLAALDGIMQQALTRYSVKGGALAVVKDGHLVFARGYGLADAEAGAPVQPDSRFRWCSMSKMLTTVALMRLVEQNKVDPDAPVFSVLDGFGPYSGAWGDGRLQRITIRQVLHHAGGWDRAVSPSRDPVVGEGTVRVAEATGTAFPPSLDAVIRYMLAQPLDFAPGTRFGYSNFGYELIGRVIEKASGRHYREFVKETILDPAGLPGVEQAGAHLSGRLPGEVRYYDFPGAPLVNSYVSPARERVEAPYGFLSSELGDSAGAWVGSAIDLAKLIALLDGMRPPGLLAPASFAAMLAQSQPAAWVDANSWYGYGLFVEPYGNSVVWYHGGSNPGSVGFFCRFTNGGGFVFLFNGNSSDASSLSAYVTQAVVDVLSNLQPWPKTDLFPQYYGPRIARGGVVDAATLAASPLAAGSAVTVSGSDLGGRDAAVTVKLRDAAGVEETLEVLYSDPSRIDTRLPATAAAGPATLTVNRRPWPATDVEISVTRTRRVPRTPVHAR